MLGPRTAVGSSAARPEATPTARSRRAATKPDSNRMWPHSHEPAPGLRAAANKQRAAKRQSSPRQSKPRSIRKWRAKLKRPRPQADPALGAQASGTDGQPLQWSRALTVEDDGLGATDRRAAELFGKGIAERAA